MHTLLVYVYVFLTHFTKFSAFDTHSLVSLLLSLSLIHSVIVVIFLFSKFLYDLDCAFVCCRNSEHVRTVLAFYNTPNVWWNKQTKKKRTHKHQEATATTLPIQTKWKMCRIRVSRCVKGYRTAFRHEKKKFNSLRNSRNCKNDKKKRKEKREWWRRQQRQ